MAEPIRSIWYEVQAEAGAEFEDFDGWLWTATFGDPGAEYEAVRSGVGMWDVYPLIKLEFVGRDALGAAQRAFTNDIMSVGEGQVRYGAFVGEDGVIVDDGTVYKLSGDRCWVMVNNPGQEGWFLELAAGMEVEIVDRTHEMPLLSVQGPRSREVLQALTDLDLTALRYFTFAPERAEVGGIPCWVLRTGFSGELGYELIPDRDGAVPLWELLRGAGVRPFGTHGIEIARIESGMIVVGVDYEPGGGRTPYDLSLDRLVKLDAGSAGADALRAVAAAPPNRLVTLRIQGDAVPGYGAAVSQDGEEVGVATSTTESPRFGAIALAMLRTELAGVGNTVEVAVGEETVPATVDIPSVYDPEKRRPRA
ncbi:MAG TPA: aminomethyltransferase family protein [Actinomycetota bacterium]|nr:aminomethyltransferase family protein [Actinomycetota bacterium]